MAAPACEASRSATGRSFRGRTWALWDAACGGACQAWPSFDAGSVVSAFTRGEERLPGDSRRVIDPGFLRRCIATGCLLLRDDRATGAAQACMDFVEFALAFKLNAEM